MVCVLETKAARLCINGTPSITSGVSERGATGSYNIWIKDIIVKHCNPNLCTKFSDTLTVWVLFMNNIGLQKDQKPTLTRCIKK